MEFIDVKEIPNTIKYIEECFEDIINEFKLVIHYSDYTWPNATSNISKGYVHKNQNSEYRYHIAVNKVKDTDGRFFSYEFNFYNDKYNTSNLYDNNFYIKNGGTTPTIDDILTEALVCVNRKRKSYLD
jgi:hypothetical protein